MVQKLIVKMFSVSKNTDFVDGSQYSKIKKSITLSPIQAAGKDKRLSKNAKLVLMGINAFLTAHNRIAFPSKTTIAENMGIGRASVTKGIHELEEFGYLTVGRKWMNGNERLLFKVPESITIEIEVSQVRWNHQDDPDQPCLDAVADKAGIVIITPIIAYFF